MIRATSRSALGRDRGQASAARLRESDGDADHGKELARRQHQQASQTRDLAPQVCQVSQREVICRHEARLEEVNREEEVDEEGGIQVSDGKEEAREARVPDDEGS